MNARHGLLALALVVTLVAAFWLEQGDELNGLEVVQAERSKAPAAATQGTTPGVPTGDKMVTAVQSAERFAAKAAGDLFPRQTWVPPPPPPKKVKPLPPPPPEPPPLPFVYLGHWLEAGRETIFLTQGEKVLQVKEGDVLAGSWRLDEVSPNQMVFTYLPLDMTRTLRITP